MSALGGATPGPWVVGVPYPDDEGYREIPIHGPAFSTPAVCLQFPNYPGMQDANARLIAAAPDLRDALRELVEAAGNPSLDALKRAEAVLARSEGQP